MNPVSVVLINDDGPTSPFFVPFLEALKRQSWCSSVNFAIPSRNRSWISSALTRHGKIRVEPVTISGVTGFLINGTPGDCASLAVHNLFDMEPTLVISGVNVGHNASAAFVSGSGTIGAASVAALCGAKALAISAAVDSKLYVAWMDHDFAALEGLHDRILAIADAATNACHKLLQAGIFDCGGYYSMNIPWFVGEGAELALTHINPCILPKLFAPVGPQEYTHSLHFGDFMSSIECQAGSDITELGNERITVTPFFHGGEQTYPPEVLAAFDRLKSIR